MNKRTLLSIFVFCFFAFNSYSAPVAPQTILLAQQAVPLATGTVSDVAAMSKLVPYMLRLPRGVVKTGLSVLPGITMKSGIKDIGTGLLATTQLAKETVRLPFRALNRVGRISPLALAGL